MNIMKNSVVIHYEHEHDNEGKEEIIVWANKAHIGYIKITGSFSEKFYQYISNGHGGNKIFKGKKCLTLEECKKSIES